MEVNGDQKPTYQNSVQQKKENQLEGDEMAERWLLTVFNALQNIFDPEKQACQSSNASYNRQTTIWALISLPKSDKGLVYDTQLLQESVCGTHKST